MEDDLKKALLNKKGANFDKLYEECIVRIQRIKQKNDFMQKQIGTDIEDEMKNEVHKQKEFIEVGKVIVRKRSSRSRTI